MPWRREMNKIIAGLLCIAALYFVPDVSAQTFTFSNLKFVVGTGTNETALVVTWNDGKTPDNLVWGYKWNMPASGTAPTIYQMMQAVAAADSRLLFYANPEYDSPSTGDYALYAAFFDLTGKGGTPVVGKPLNLGGSENGYPPYSGDHYEEGWYTGFWGEVVGIGNPYNGGSWNSSDSVAHGVAVDKISNNGWYAVSFSKDATYPFTIPNPGFPYAVSPPGQPVPVPAWASELCGLALGVAGMFACWKRKPHHA